MSIFFRRIPKNVPEDMQKLIYKISKSKSKEEALKKSYSFLSKKYHGAHIFTFTRIPDLFVNLDTMWNKKGFLHCTNLNYLLRILLIKSGLFDSKDIKKRWTTVWGSSPHQYLLVRIADSKWIDVDVWSKEYGIKLGDHAHGLH